MLRKIRLYLTVHFLNVFRFILHFSTHVTAATNRKFVLNVSMLENDRRSKFSSFGDKNAKTSRKSLKLQIRVN